MSAEILRKRSAKIERIVKWRNIREYGASLIVAGLLGYSFIRTDDVLFRVTFGLLIAGLIWMVVQLHRKGSAKKMPTNIDTLTSLRIYRTELERQRDAVRSVWSWYLAPLVPGLLLYTIGYAIRVPRPGTWAKLVLLDAAIGVMFYVVLRINARAARCLQRMIDDLLAAENQN